MGELELEHKTRIDSPTLQGMPGTIHIGWYRVKGDLANRSWFANCPDCNPDGERTRIRASNGELGGEVRCLTCEWEKRS